MLANHDQYERACKVVSKLEKKIRAGIASQQEKERARAGAEEIVCFELVELGREQRERMVKRAKRIPPRVPGRKTFFVRGST